MIANIGVSCLGTIDNHHQFETSPIFRQALLLSRSGPGVTWFWTLFSWHSSSNERPYLFPTTSSNIDPGRSLSRRTPQACRKKHRPYPGYEMALCNLLASLGRTQPQPRFIHDFLPHFSPTSFWKSHQPLSSLVL